MLAFAEKGYINADGLSGSLPARQKQRIVSLVQQYGKLPNDERTAFCEELLEHVPVDAIINVKRANLADPDQYVTNGIVVRVRRVPASFWTAVYRLEGQERLKFATKIESVKNRLLKDLGLDLPHWAHAWAEGPAHVHVVSSVELPETVPYYQARLVRESMVESQTLPQDRETGIVRSLIMKLVEAAAGENGWRKHRLKNEFYHYGQPTQRRLGGFQWTEFPCMRVEPIAVPEQGGDQRAVVVADPRQRQVMTITDWQESHHRLEDIIEYANSSGDPPIFVIQPDSEDCVLPNPAMLRQARTGDDTVEVETTFNPRRLFVKTRDLAIGRDAIDGLLSSPPARPKTTLDPATRLDLAKKWLAQVPSNVKIDAFQMTSEAPGSKLGAFQANASESKIWRLNPPQLLFNQKRQRDQASADPRSLFKYGPYSSTRKVRIAAVIFPDELSDADASTLLSSLQEAYSAANLGDLDIQACTTVRYKGAKIEEARTGLQSLSPPAEKNELILVVGRNEGMYGRAKDLAAAVGRRPGQFCHLATAKKIARGSLPTAKGLALQMYLKTLRAGDAPWILADVVGSDKTLFLGIGHSRNAGEEANSHASLTMGDGVLLAWKPMGFSMRPRRYFDKTNAHAFVRFLEIEATNHPHLERFVIVRRGDVYPAERAAIQAELDELKPKWTLDFVGITESNVRVFQDGDQPKNPEAGLLVLLSDNRCLLSGSTLPNEHIPEGSVRLLELTRAIGRTAIEDLGRELYDQTFLCWGSPAKPPKTPMPLDLGEKVADLALSASREEVFQYFPL